MKVLVTGAAGRLGQQAVAALLGAGHEVIASDVVYRADLGCELRLVDLTDRVRVVELCVGMDAVVHLGNHPDAHALRPAARVLLENTAMNTHVFDALEQTGVKKAVFASSIQAVAGCRTYANADTVPTTVAYLPMDGRVPQNPMNHYGLSKVMGEHQLQMLCRKDPRFAGVAVRFPWLSSADVPEHVHKPDEIRANPRWARHVHIDEGFCYLPIASAAALLVALVERMTPGYDCLLPAADDNLLRWPAQRVAAEFYPGVPVRSPLEGRRGLIDTTEITRRYGWAPPPALAAEQAAAGSAA